MRGFGARRRTRVPGSPTGATLPEGRPTDRLPAFELSLPEYRALVRVIEHAHACLVLRGDCDAETVRNASGAELAPLLRQRAAATDGQGGGGVPMLAREIRHLEAAVVNLESYGGHETVLCEGYALLERCESLKEGDRTARVHEGVITLGSHTPPAATP
ncbi:hypothetical protein ABZ478_21000 [Streptomyces sp. NPDC005706]|uniref:hypothetical protein n=1 Tax=Streptomyces sp. NPDC005706 TaxID=3157169 RepID=UPI0033C692E2